MTFVLRYVEGHDLSGVDLSQWSSDCKIPDPENKHEYAFSGKETGENKHEYAFSGKETGQKRNSLYLFFICGRRYADV